MDVDRFREDLDSIVEKARVKDKDMLKSIDRIKNRLINLYKRNIIKINHSVMELIVAIHLLKHGYEGIEVEKELDSILRCDVYAKKGDGNVIVEIETGFIPPDHALDPMQYYKARLASKIARYSKYASKFILATPQQSILPIDHALIKPIKDRSKEEVVSIKELCDVYYKNPPIEYEEIQYARLHSIYVLSIDDASVFEFDPIRYDELLMQALKEFKVK